MKTADAAEPIPAAPRRCSRLYHVAGNARVLQQVLRKLVAHARSRTNAADKITFCLQLLENVYYDATGRTVLQREVASHRQAQSTIQAPVNRCCERRSTIVSWSHDERC
jgi:hypothetical protein